MQNPLSGGQRGPFDLSKMNKNPYNSEFIGIGKDQTNLFGYKVPDHVIKEQEEYAKNNPINMYNMTPPSELDLLKPLKPKSDDPLVQGYLDSDFYSNTMTADVVPYTYQGKEMSGSGSYASNFKDYLDSIGKGDLIQFPDQGIAQEGSGPLTNVGGFDTPEAADPNNLIDGYTPPTGGTLNGMPLFPEQGVGQDVTGNNPIETLVPSTPNPIQGTGLDGAPVNSYNRVGKQLTGPDQFGDLNSRLNKIEQGIMSLLGNRGQNSSMNFNSPYNFNWGLSSFPPFGGMYG